MSDPNNPINVARNLTMAKRLKLARVEAGLTQTKLGELAGIHQANIANIELGKTNATSNTYDRLFAAIQAYAGPSVTLQAVDGTLGIRGRAEGKLIVVDPMGEPQPVEWLADHVLARGFVTIVAGEPGAGKSALLQTLGVAFAGGADEAAGLSLPGRPLRVLILDAENVFAMDDEHVNASLVQDRLQAFGLSVETAVNVVIAGTAGFDLRADFQALDGILKDYADDGKPFDVLILDSMRSLWPSGNENVQGQVQPMLENLNLLAAKHSIAVALIHHTTKDGESFAGSSAIAGTVAIVFTFTRAPEAEPGDGDPTRYLNCVKMRIAPEPKPFRMFMTGRGMVAEP